MSLPDRFRTHTITIEAYQGTTGMGAPSYGAPVEVTCRVEDQVRMVRSSTGEEVVSSTTVYCDLDVNAPPQSRVTIGARTTTVITTTSHDTGGRSELEHKELALE